MANQLNVNASLSITVDATEKRRTGIIGTYVGRRARATAARDRIVLLQRGAGPPFCCARRCARPFAFFLHAH